MSPVLVNGEYQCQCASSYQQVTSDRLNQSKCVKQSQISVLNAKVTLNLAGVVTFADFDASETGSSDTKLSFTSALYKDVFLLAAEECYFYRNEQQNQFCQALGNLCVLQHFSPQASSCAFLDLIQRSGRTTTANGIPGWYATLPFLDYGSSTQSVLESTAIGMKMSFDEDSQGATTDHLEFVLVTYDVTGAMKSVKRLTSQFLYCLSEVSIGTPLWMRFGASSTSRYTCDLGILDASVTELYELYLVDRSKNDGDDGRFVPVPVQNLNYKDEKGFAINANKQPDDTADDFLSHRFFLYDFQSGVAVGESKPKAYRYAETITLTIRTQKSKVKGIYPPLLSISYVDTQSLRNTSVQFHATYASDTTKFWATAMALFIIACGIAGCRVVLQTYTWQRRSTRNEEIGAAVWHTLTHLATCSAANFARASFSVLLAMCAYFLVFFKLQSTVYLMLPEVNYHAFAKKMDAYYPFRVLLPLSFSLQLASVLHKVYVQTQIQLLFIDWEKPRAKVIDVDSAKSQNAPISIWRTILVANEWKRLQVARRSSFELTVVVLLFLLYGCDLRSAAIPIPKSQMKYVGNGALLTATDSSLSLNPYLGFANVSCLWLLLCAIQRLWKWLVFERYFDEPRECLFIDLCTVAKVSCLFLDEPYHGFYLHCRSPYPFADGNMSEIVDQLKQEEAGLTVGRGLDSSLPDCQAFEMFVTRKWKRKFQTHFAAIHGGVAGPTKGLASSAAGKSGQELLRRHRPFAQSTSKSGSGALIVTQAMVKHHNSLSDFLKSFIENQEEQFRWRIYRAQTCLGSFFGIPPEVTSSKQSLFLPGGWQIFDDELLKVYL